MSCELSAMLYSIMKVVIEIVNFVEACALNSSLFQKLCSSCEALHQLLLFHYKIRWPLHSKVLAHVIELKRELEIFYGRNISCLAKNFCMKKGFYFSLTCVI